MRSRRVARHLTGTDDRADDLHYALCTAGARAAMSEFSRPKNADEGVMRDAEDGIGAMVRALHDQKVSAGVMVDAALHILAAWEASRQTKFTVAERETCIEELMGMLPAHFDMSLAEGWLPDAHGG